MDLLTRPEVITATLAIIGVTALALIYVRPSGRRIGLGRPRAVDPDGGRKGPDVTFHMVNPAPARPSDRSEVAVAGPGPGPAPRRSAVAFSDVTSGHPKVTFADVAGLDHAIAELGEVREYLADPARFRALGAELPRGIVLHGLPGCGKTLLARALAGEAGVPFYFVSAASFVEKFVGTGAARVRELFDEALRHAPSIIFIDELDAIGRRRRGDSPGEREFDNTLNQLLVELDGFRGSSGVLILGATNRLELIDAALLRPGRFDRKIEIERPDRAGREKILRLHASRRPMAPAVDWADVAESTPGLSAAELANIVNEASLLAARRHGREVSPGDVGDACSRVLSGTRGTRLMGEEEKRTAAVHESGHAVLSVLMKGMRPPPRISLMSTVNPGSKPVWASLSDREILTKRDLIAQLVVLLGGRAAELNVLGEPSNKAEDDLEHAAALARQMVERWAMTGRFELAGGERDAVRYHIEGSAGGNEVRDLVARSEKVARSILSDNAEDLKVVAAALECHETLTAADLNDLVGSGSAGRPGDSGRHLRVV